MHNKKLKFKFTSILLTVLLSISSLTACTLQTSNTTGSNNTALTTSSKTTSWYTPGKAAGTGLSVKYDSTDMDTGWSSDSSTIITFFSDTIDGYGEGIVINKNIVTITSAGTYIISGTINDGRIIVDTKEDQPVRLVLNGADITCMESAPIYISSAEKAVLTLPEGTNNNITDGKNYVVGNDETDEPDSAIFSKSDLTINGTGSLTINANYKNAITSKDELKIMSGNITLNSAGDGIKGRDFVAIRDGIVNINAKEDGIKSNNDAEKGFVYIEGGSVNIIALEDGIQAETDISIETAAINITSGGGYANGETKADEQSGRGGFGSSGRSASQASASEDSTDDETISKKGLKAANSSIYITSGTVVVNGPTENNNGALDYDGTFKMTGGLLVAAGSSGMAQGPDESSTQNSAIIFFNQVMPAGTPVRITSDDGKELLTFKPSKDYQTIVVNSPELKKGTTYTIYYGGSSSGSEKNGLSKGGSFSGGTKYESFTVTDLLTTVGTAGRSNPGGGPGGKQGSPPIRNNQ